MAAALAIPAIALAGYLDAKHKITTDLHLISTLTICKIGAALAEKRDKVNPFYILETHAQKIPTRSFLWFQGTDYTYSNTFELVKRHANWLKDRYGVKKGDIVGLDFVNSPEMIWVWLGLWAIGAYPAFVNYNLSGDALIHVVKISTAKLFVIGSDVDAKVSAKKILNEALPGVEIAIFDDGTESECKTWRADRPADEERSGAKIPEMCSLIYTSGTTGLPKPAIISWWKPTGAAKFVSYWIKLNPAKDRFYTCMPLYHSSAAVFNLMACLQVGGTCCLGAKFSNKTFWPEVRASRATIIQYVGETCRYLLAAPPSPDDKNHNVRMAFGNGLRPDVWREFRNRFGIKDIAEFYAATEGMSATWNYNSGEYGVGAIGSHGTIIKKLFGGKSAIVEIDYETEEILREPGTGFCRRVAEGEKGEMLYWVDENDIGDLYRGYFNNEKATNSKILRNVFRKGDAWFRTGDILTTSNDGLVYFNDRIGDTYRWKSENISTTEVSNTLNAHPRKIILDSAVFGVPLPNHDGNCGVAAVVLNPDVAEDQATFDEILKFIQAGLPRFALPLFIRVIDEVERTGNNKVVKGGLRKQGVDPEKVSHLWWLKDGRYQKFTENDYREINAGRIKL